MFTFMKHHFFLGLGLIWLICVGSLNAQQRGLENELSRLQSTIERTEAFVRLLPATNTNDIRNRIDNLLNDARNNYQQAEQLASQNKPVLARLRIREAFAALRQIEMLLKDNPVLKFKYQEQLDQKIQEAEELVQQQQIDEALYLLNRAKYFRQRAYSLFREGQSFSAIEYYRLSLHFAEESIQLYRTTDKRNSGERIRQSFLDAELLISQIRAKLDGNNSDETQKRLLQSTEAELTTVKRLFEQRNFSEAQQRLTGINRVLYRLLESVEKMPQTDDEQLQLDLQSLRYALSQVREMLQNNELPAAETICQRASALADRSEMLLNQGKTVQARRNLFFANQMVVRLYRLLENQQDSQPEQLQQQVERTRENVIAMRSQSADWDADNAFAEMTERNFAVAEQAYAAGDYGRAAQFLNIANKLVLQFNRLQLEQTNSNIASAVVKEELQRFQQMLERLRDRGATDATFEITFQNAGQLYRLAEAAFRRNRLLVCRELTRLGTRMLTEN